MGEFIANAIVWTLAFYGMFEIIKTILYVCSYTNLKSDGIYVIIAAKNQENKIEVFLRSLLFRVLYGKEEYIKEIIVTDLDSKDNTIEILNRMQISKKLWTIPKKCHKISILNKQDERRKVC